MTTTMRVRELSAELGISNKELIQMLRDEDIQVKSHMSGLTDEEVEMVRAKMHDKSQSAPSKHTLTSSGVIVRRRKRVKKPQESQEAAPQEAEQPPEAAETSSAQKVKAEEPSPREERAEAPSEVEAAPSEELTEAGTEPEAAEQELEQEQEETAESKTRSKRKKKSRKKKDVPPSVTVISRPEVPVEPAPKPPQTAAPAAEKPQDDKQKEAAKKKKKKDKRTVDVSGLYDESEARKNKVDWKKKKTTDIKDKTGGKTAKGKRKRGQEPLQPEPQASTQPAKAAKRKIKMEEAIRVSDLAHEMGIKAQEIIKDLLNLGVMATINQSLDVDTATLVAADFGYEVEKVGFSEDEFILPQKEDQPEDKLPRSPVVTIMGHVDHGKTSLLDAIRKSKIASGEAGGITQHIGAYYVQTKGGSMVFLDTPGHEAFTEMRSRGAQVTDLVILIVAADDGVMDQTKEAISHAKAAQVPIIVAVNKIDKDNADLERVKRELAEQGLVSEEWGGDTMYSYISAKQKIGLDELLESVLLQAEVLELKANPNKRARGHIVEAKLDKGRGPVGTVLIQEGTIHTGDPFVCGLFHGKVRALFNDLGQKIEQAGPATPVEIQGFEGVPNAGDEFVAVENDKVAKRIAETRQTKHRERELAKETKVTLESFFAAKAEEEAKVLNLILKADVQGSLEAIHDSVQKLATPEVKVDIIHGGIGAITESDVKLAAASSAVIIGFNVRPTAKVKDLAEEEGVDIRFYNVIYQLVSDVKEAMAGMLAPVTREVYLGQAEVRETFSVPKFGTIAGCFVLDGKLKRNAMVRLLRNGVVITTGKLGSLKRFKDDVKEVAKDYECGAGLENYNDIKIGDIIEAYEEVQEKATLE